MSHGRTNHAGQQDIQVNGDPIHTLFLYTFTVYFKSTETPDPLLFFLFDQQSLSAGGYSWLIRMPINKSEINPICSRLLLRRGYIGLPLRQLGRHSLTKISTILISKFLKQKRVSLLEMKGRAAALCCWRSLFFRCLAILSIGDLYISVLVAFVTSSMLEVVYPSAFNIKRHYM